MKNNKLGISLPIVIIIIVIIIGAVVIFSTSSKKSKTDQPFADENGEDGNGTVLAGDLSPVIDFNKSDFEEALKSDKLVVLYFYATWCPLCVIEIENSFYPAFEELNNDNVIAFRINYNDINTDSNEKELARKFGIAYQHTKVILKNGERILKSAETWDKDRYLTEINNALGEQN